jgi:hypothetical protein
MDGTRPGRRVTQREAAEILGVSVEAIRKRAKRGTLRSEKGEDGRRYVYLDDAPDAAHPQVEDEDSSSPLVESKDETIRLLREQLEQANERDRENRRIIAALTSRIPELEAPSGPREAPTEATEQPGRVEPQPAVQGAQEPAQPRAWWRRMFGG